MGCINVWPERKGKGDSGVKQVLGIYLPSGSNELKKLEIGAGYCWCTVVDKR